MKPEDPQRALKQNPEGVRFEFICCSAAAFGFHLRDARGGRRISVRDGVRELLNLQEQQFANFETWRDEKNSIVKMIASGKLQKGVAGAKRKISIAITLKIRKG